KRSGRRLDTEGFWCIVRTGTMPGIGSSRSLTRRVRGGKSDIRRTRKSGRRTRPRTRTAPASGGGGRPDRPTGRRRRTRCRARGAATRRRSAWPEPPPGTGGRRSEGRRARWSLLRGFLSGVGMVEGYLYHAGRAVTIESDLTILGANGDPETFLSRNRACHARPEDRLAEVSTSALLLVIGLVFTIVGVVFVPFLCIGVPLLIV